MSVLELDIDGLIFETFAWNFHHPAASAVAVAASLAAAGAAGLDSEANTPTAGSLMPSSSASAPAATASAASPFSCEADDCMVSSIPLKPGGTHLKVGRGCGLGLHPRTLIPRPAPSSKTPNAPQGNDP